MKEPAKMDKTYQTLDDILNDSEFGDLFDIKPTTSIITADDRLIESFNEINKFIDEHGYEPSNMLDMNERKLAKRLEGIRNDPEKILVLKVHDKHNILQVEEKQLKSLDDILQDDFLADILDVDTTASLDIFNLKHVKHNSERQESDFIARRKACKNFAKYEPLFKQCQADLKSSKRSLILFDEKNLVASTFFVLNGQLGYLENISAPVKRSGNRHDGRTYCIFENGTESNMQFLSLAARLYEARKENQAFTVSLTQEEANTKFVHSFNQISDNDKSTGYIYILKSKSNNPKIANIDNLYKIGYSTTPVEERIKNAENEPTYLMAEVEIISVYECYNLNPQKFEHIMHTFFAEACLNLDVFGTNGKRYNPREWFILPLDIIQNAISLIIHDQIQFHQYDHIMRKIYKNSI